MITLNVASTKTLTYHPEVNGVAITEALPSPPTVEILDGNLAPVTLGHTPAWDGVDGYFLTIDPVEVPVEKAGEIWQVTWTWVKDGATLSDTDYVAVTVGETGLYGTVAGVQEYFPLRVIHFAPTSQPFTSRQVAVALIQHSRIVNMKLVAAEYEVPVTTDNPDAYGIITDIVQKLVASDVMQRIDLTRSESPVVVATAGTWRKQAEQTLEDILNGDLVLPGTTRAGAYKVSIPGVITAPAAIDVSVRTQDFITYRGGYSPEVTS